MMKTCLIVALALCAVLMGMPASASTCESLSSLKLANTTITSAQSVAKGAFTLPPGSVLQQPGGLTALNTLPAFCRVQGFIQPSSDSHIEFEVWLPPISDWNGKYQGIGNGGYAGSISYEGLTSAIMGHYAAASTDTGHKIVSIDARWALGHPEKIIDFGYRAVHETALTAKEVIKAFYGTNPQHSYFNSCSNGGRQGLMEAQRFPADYDGIIAGAPANFWTHLCATGIWNMQAIASDKASYLSVKKLAAIEAAVQADCDELDNVKDGVIENPMQCKVDASKLLCSGTETDHCITNPQLTALKKIYGGPRNEKGDQMFPGISPGGEAEDGGWGLWVTGKDSYTQSYDFAFGTQFFQNMVYSDPSWDFHTFNWDRDMKAVDDKLAQIFNATAPDLSRFKKRGGKLILYHGWNDAAIPALNSIDYYQSVVSRMGQKESDEFIRLFMVPGMQHCFGGAGPYNFGQVGVSQGDPENSIGTVIERWVEKNVAPDKIIATKYKTNDNPASGISRTRPLCPYPQVAKYKGSGSTDEAANFTCAEGK